DNHNLNLGTIQSLTVGKTVNGKPVLGTGTVSGLIRAAVAIENLVIQILSGTLTTGQLGSTSPPGTSSVSVATVTQTGSLTATQTQGGVNLGNVMGSANLGALAPGSSVFLGDVTNIEYSSIGIGSAVNATSIGTLTIDNDLSGTVNV